MHNKRKNTFSSILKTNKEAIAHLYYKYIFLIIIFGTILTGIVFYKLGAHIVLFGDTDSALGEYVKTVATVLGGALVILGLWINNRRVTEQIRQNNIAEKGQINTRFKDAATLLGSENVSSILSGVYALHQIAMETSVGNESQRGYVNIVHDILCAYIRENTDTVRNEEKGKDWRINKKPAIVVQTIMKVLFKNNGFIYSDLVTDLSNCVFEHIYLDDAYIANVDFSRTKFIKSDIKHASFVSCYLEETFIDETDFAESSFEKVVFDFAYIRNSSFMATKISNSDFWDAVLAKVNFKGAQFKRVDFKNVIIEEGTDFADTIFANHSFEEIRTKSVEITRVESKPEHR